MAEFYREHIEWKPVEVTLQTEHLGEIVEYGIAVQKLGEQAIWYSGNTELFFHDDKQYDHARIEEDDGCLTLMKLPPNIEKAMMDLDFPFRWRLNPEPLTVDWLVGMNIVNIDDEIEEL